MERSGCFFLLKIALLLLAAVGVAYLLFAGRYAYAVVLFVVLLCCANHWLTEDRRLLHHFSDFAEAVRYRDFTRWFAVRNAKTKEGRLFSAFNEINAVYRQIGIDKEVQQQYLNKVVNMLDSAILFYRPDSGRVVWINDAFRQLFGTPHLGNIQALLKKHPDLYEQTLRMKPGKQQMETVGSPIGKVKLLMHSAEFEMEDGIFRILVCQNISEALDATETKAWHKLLRVLTHEIMNSIAPISSLAETLHERLEKGFREEDIEDLKVGIHTIKRRSEGLLQFAKNYRLINKVDRPQPSDLQLKVLFEHLYSLFEPTLLQRGIDLDIILKDIRLSLRADANLIEQALINLLQNAIEAVRDRPKPYISLRGIRRDGRVLIQVRDNGRGMSAKVQEQIFTPFFTTKKSGSGVGLTLCKQIVLLHGGRLSVESEEGKGSTFTLAMENGEWGI